ncbi:DUF4278 domain-containing protein [Oscillatoria sp. FACHB-1406]|uniref:DUF4278 domain-containing protein n=1 Tax=Oscillatoria sp. FACHB-1406 TaxID=2692846 RepID=UPI0016853DB9|nr:DUF4278 domain-containing protein [Oscillatoria sp. FACHB-1406]MBD2578677.1 DUF4278 domain-containing protein [Oscillatoria sp. FACHB-1406]
MRLIYRGVSYESQPLSLEVTEREASGVYRGETWKHHYPKHLPNAKPNSHTLQYRGVQYQPHPILLAETRIGCSLPTIAQPESQWLAAVPQVLRHEAEQRHLSNLHRNLLYRLQIAKQKGNEVLVRQLEEESKQLALSV